jgi:hypothetical protein
MVGCRVSHAADSTGHGSHAGRPHERFAGLRGPVDCSTTSLQAGKGAGHRRREYVARHGERVHAEYPAQRHRQVGPRRSGRKDDDCVEWQVRRKLRQAGDGTRPMTRPNQVSVSGHAHGEAESHEGGRDHWSGLVCPAIAPAPRQPPEPDSADRSQDRDQRDDRRHQPPHHPGMVAGHERVGQVEKGGEPTDGEERDQRARHAGPAQPHRADGREDEPGPRHVPRQPGKRRRRAERRFSLDARRDPARHRGRAKPYDEQHGASAAPCGVRGQRRRTGCQPGRAAQCAGRNDGKADNPHDQEPSNRATEGERTVGCGHVDRSDGYPMKRRGS